MYVCLASRAFFDGMHDMCGSKMVSIEANLNAAMGLLVQHIDLLFFFCFVLSTDSF